MAAQDKPTEVNSLNSISETDIPEITKELLEKYSHIPRDRLVQHVTQLREKAFARFPYPCIGQYRFLILTLESHPRYHDILQRVRGGQTFLDAGACFGQDLRKLVADGAPSSNTYGFDIDGELIDVGYDLFLDRDTLKTKFLVRDVFDQSADWSPLEGKIDVIHASAFIHLFNWQQQVHVATVLARILRPVPGSMIVGRQMGSTEPGEYPALKPGTMLYWHDETSFQKLWDEVGQVTGTKWRVQATLDTVGLEGLGKVDKKPHSAESNRRRQLFTVTRM